MSEGKTMVSTKKLLAALLGTLSGLMCLEPVPAGAAVVSNPGTFMGLFDGNNDNQTFAQLETLLGLAPGTLVGKLGSVQSGTITAGGGVGASNNLTLSLVDVSGNVTPFTGLQEGSWSTIDPIGYFIVKDGRTDCTGSCAVGSLGQVAGLYDGGGSAFAVYYYAAPTTSGTWSMEKFYNAKTKNGVTTNTYHDLSHASGYSVVPIPAALPLMLSGLAALFGFRRLSGRRTDEATAIPA